MIVTYDDIGAAIEILGLSHRPLCVHASLRSFGWVEGGADTVVNGLLAEGCTVMVPAWTLAFAIDPERPTGEVYSPDSNQIDAGMGAIPAAVVEMPGRARGNHPLCSFAAIGPLAHELIAGQTPLDVFVPLRALAEADGWVILMGVGLHRMTLIHLAEQMAGRKLLRRWAKGPDQQPMEVAIGGCSLGFWQLECVIWPLCRYITVGESNWQAFPARRMVDWVAEAIRKLPQLTHCGDPRCVRCNAYLEEMQCKSKS